MVEVRLDKNLQFHPVFISIFKAGQKCGGDDQMWDFDQTHSQNALRVFACLLLFFCAGLCQVGGGCSKTAVYSCSDCIRSGPGCAWCMQEASVTHTSSCSA